MSLVLFGPPGSGKGTQCQFLCEKLKLKHISTGDIFRRMIREKSPLGEELNKLLSSGQLVPDELTIQVLKEELQKFPGEKFLFDGFPRTRAQADQLLKLMAQLSDQVEKAIFMDVPDTELVQRLTGRRTCSKCQTVYNIFSSPPKTAGVCDKCGGELVQRSDDSEGVVKERLRVYRENTQPLVDYFKSAGLYSEVQATGDVKTVTDRIIKLI